MKKDIGVILVHSNGPAKFPTDDLQHMKKPADAAGHEFAYVVHPRRTWPAPLGQRARRKRLFDAGGKLVYRGAMDDDAHNPDHVKKRYLQDATAALLEGPEVTPRRPVA